LASTEEKKISEMVEAMRVACHKMFSVHSFHEDELLTKNENGRLTIDCPIGRSGLYPSDAWKENGRVFSGHNVNNAAQQITLIAGLAALHDKTRKEIYKF
jgi:hypothetical protein